MRTKALNIGPWSSFSVDLKDKRLVSTMITNEKEVKSHNYSRSTRQKKVSWFG